MRIRRRPSAASARPAGEAEGRESALRGVGGNRRLEDSKGKDRGEESLLSGTAECRVVGRSRGVESQDGASDGKGRLTEAPGLEARGGGGSGWSLIGRWHALAGKAWTGQSTRHADGALWARRDCLLSACAWQRK